MIEPQLSIPSSARIPACDYVIIGGTGDLALRKIYPSLFWRYLHGQITQDFRIISAARHSLSLEALAQQMRPFCQEALEGFDDAEKQWQGFLTLFHSVTLDVNSTEDAQALEKLMMQQCADDRPWIFYLAISPALFGVTCQTLAQTGLVRPQSRVVVEKPLGSDRQSAAAINDKILRVFQEHQIYRIDHYLGKETVQNLMALRFANVIFETQWNNNSIDHVQITVAEKVGVESRVDYYDHYGALRDMVQNHLLQLLCLVAMEPPAKFRADQVRDEKLRVLRALRPAEPQHIVRGQYTGYQTELGRTSQTETYVAMKVWIDNWRWAGVPFYLRTGKKMSQRVSEIVITFKDRAHDIFASSGAASVTQPNRLIVRVQPNEGLRLQLTAKEPGPGGMRLFPSELNLSFDEAFKQRLPDAYERLLMDIARGNQTLFMRLDEVLAAWEFIDPIIAFSRHTAPLPYAAGSIGPQDYLLREDNRQWWEFEDHDGR